MSSEEIERITEEQEKLINKFHTFNKFFHAFLFHAENSGIRFPSIYFFPF